MPEFKCYWKVINSDLKVALIFGPLAEKKYRIGMTAWAGLQGRGDPYRTLLREGITALLNSYNSLLFPYNALSVVQYMNMALMGSTRNVLFTALRFKRANSGYDKYGFQALEPPHFSSPEWNLDCSSGFVMMFIGMTTSTSVMFNINGENCRKLDQIYRRSKRNEKSISCDAILVCLMLQQ
ncbi:hypothetical protein Ancab_028032 [Ancistrocladus abbreviatus]